jgi:hypothetical protein
MLCSMRCTIQEINFRIIADWDLGFLVQLGAVDSEAYVRTSTEAAGWLDREARRLYPESKYATGSDPPAVPLR